MKSYKWQEETEIECRTRNEYALFCDTGVGKTKTMIDIMRYKYNTEQRIFPTIILAPLSVLYNWKKEFTKWSKIDPAKIFIPSGTGKKRIETLAKFIENKDGIVVTNYESMRSDELFNLLKQFNAQALILDECHQAKTYNALQSKRAYELSVNTKYRFLMSATPISNSLLDIFQQFKILDNGKTFGTNYFVFRSKYFIDLNAAWANKNGHFPKFVVNPKMLDEVNSFIYKKAVRVLKKDCLDLPPLVITERYASMSDKQRKLYTEMKKSFITWLDEQKEIASIASIALVKALRLCQIIAHHLVDDKGEIHVIDGPNPKLDIVSEIMDEVCPSAKLIVWCVFIEDVKQIQALCKKKSITYSTIAGGQNSKERQEEIDNFNKKQEYRVCIANIAAGSTGCELTEASYSCVYSRNFSLNHHEQSIGRNYRSGSEKFDKITRIEIIMKDTIDEVIVEALRNKKDLATRVIDYIKGEEL